MNRTETVVPLVDVRASFLSIREELLREFEAILDRMHLSFGENLLAFECEFAAYCESEHGIAVSSGTDALLLALLAYEIGPGDEVIVPSHTFFASVEAVIHTGATPVLVDVEPDTLNVDANEVRAAITGATRAIVPVHLYGHPADMDPILELAREHGLIVIEDAAQAHGARYKGRRCGAMGDTACFSFYFAKNLGAFGEAGFVTTRDPNAAERMRLLRHHGHVSKFEHAIVGYNHRMDELQAAVLRLKLPGLDARNARRRELAARYRAAFADAPIRPPGARDDCEPVHHVYPVRVKERDALQEHLTRSGIGTGIHYQMPAHLQPALRRHAYRRGNLKVTEEACAELLSLPMFPELSDEQFEYVVRHVREFTLGRASASAAKAAAR